MKAQTFDLTPTDSRKSFYGKAKVITEGNTSKLQSYDTIVAECVKGDSPIMLIHGWYSATTARHINAFLSLHGLPSCTKKEMLSYNDKK